MKILSTNIHQIPQLGMQRSRTKKSQMLSTALVNPSDQGFRVSIILSYSWTDTRQSSKMRPGRVGRRWKCQTLIRVQ